METRVEGCERRATCVRAHGGWEVRWRVDRGGARGVVEVCAGVRREIMALQPRVKGGKGGVGWRVEWGMRASR